MKPRFCPRCGTADKPFVQGFCADCFLESNPVLELPTGLKVLECRTCAKVLLEGKWVLFSLERVSDWVLKKIKVKQLEKPRIDLNARQTPTGFALDGKLLGSLSGHFVERVFLVEVKKTVSLCMDCSKLSANYYEAILQLRLDSLPKKDWKMVLEKAQREVEKGFATDSLSRVSNALSLKNGFDLFIGSKRAGKIVSQKLVQKFGGKITRSFSLAGIDKTGKEKKRYTFLVRI